MVELGGKAFGGGRQALLHPLPLRHADLGNPGVLEEREGHQEDREQHGGQGGHSLRIEPTRHAGSLTPSWPGTYASRPSLTSLLQITGRRLLRLEPDQLHQRGRWSSWPRPAASGSRRSSAARRRGGASRGSGRGGRRRQLRRSRRAARSWVETAPIAPWRSRWRITRRTATWRSCAVRAAQDLVEQIEERSALPRGARRPRRRRRGCAAARPGRRRRRRRASPRPGCWWRGSTGGRRSVRGADRPARLGQHRVDADRAQQRALARHVRAGDQQERCRAGRPRRRWRPAGLRAAADARGRARRSGPVRPAATSGNAQPGLSWRSPARARERLEIAEGGEPAPDVGTGRPLPALQQVRGCGSPTAGGSGGRSGGCPSGGRRESTMRLGGGSSSGGRAGPGAPGPRRSAGGAAPERRSGSSARARRRARTPSPRLQPVEAREQPHPMSVGEGDVDRQQQPRRDGAPSAGPGRTVR